MDPRADRRIRQLMPSNVRVAAGRRAVAHPRGIDPPVAGMRP